MNTFNTIISVIALAYCQFTIGECIDNDRFIVNADQETVIDTDTNLMWQYCSMGQSGVYCEQGDATKYSYQSANSLAQDITTANLSDWRLPTVKELNSIVDVRCYAPSIASNVFPATPEQYVWSSDIFIADLSKAWAVNFESGEDGVAHINQNLIVRLVRSID